MEKRSQEVGSQGTAMVRAQGRCLPSAQEDTLSEGPPRYPRVPTPAARRGRIVPSRTSASIKQDWEGGKKRKACPP